MISTQARLLLVRTALILVAVLSAIVTVYALGPAHADAAEDAWLQQHARPSTYDVIELGELRADGTATAVWVSQNGEPNAFVDLRHSDQRIDAIGQAVRARVHNRDAPATTSGAASDAVGRSFLGSYIGAGWPLVLTAGGVLALIRLRRKVREPAPVGA